MNYIDLIFLLFFAWGAYKGYEKGFIVQSLTLLALIVGIWAGYKFSGLSSAFLADHFHISGRLLPILAFASVFLLIIITVYFIGRFITSLIGETVLGTLNRVGGIMFGIIKMVFILSLLLLIIERVDLHNHLIKETDKKQSLFYAPVAKIAPAIFPYLHFEEIKNGLLKV